MKGLLSAIILALPFLQPVVFAQPQDHMGGGQPGQGTMKHPGTQMSQHQTLSQEMMRGMSHLMIRMQEMIHDTARAMEQIQSINEDRRREMSRIMAQMSDQLQAMSREMASGSVDRDRLQKMDRDMDRIQDMINNVQPSGR